jgi:hypothetical protein
MPKEDVGFRIFPRIIPAPKVKVDKPKALRNRTQFFDFFVPEMNREIDFFLEIRNFAVFMLGSGFKVGDLLVDPHTNILSDPPDDRQNLADLFETERTTPID